MQPTQNLKPCPFCGSNRLAYNGGAIHCGGCSAMGPFAATEEKASEFWNRRADRIAVEKTVHVVTKAETSIDD